MTTVGSAADSAAAAAATPLALAVATNATSATISLLPLPTAAPRWEVMLKLILPVLTDGIGAATTEMVSPSSNHDLGHALHLFFCFFFFVSVLDACTPSLLTILPLEFLKKGFKPRSL